MTKRLDKKSSSQESARAVASRLASSPHPISERQWTVEAQVSPSFFSNLRGTPTKPPSDPSVDQLRQVLKVRGITLPEFFLPEAKGSVVKTPSRQAVESAFEAALDALPSKRAARAAYLAEVVAGVLGLPEGLPAIPIVEGSSEPAAPEASAPLRAATKRQ